MSHTQRFLVVVGTIIVGSAVLATAHFVLGVEMTEPMQTPGGWLLAAQTVALTIWQGFGK